MSVNQIMRCPMAYLQVGKQFDGLLIDTSAPSPSFPVFDTTPSDTTNVRR